MTDASPGLPAPKPRIVLRAVALGVVLVGCRGIIGIEEPPPGVLDPNDAGDGPSSGDGGARIDPAWASWRMPPDQKPNMYEVGPGLAHDNVTGLVWQRATGTPAMWAKAKADCEALTLNGRTGFRLPTRIELLSIVDFSLPVNGNPFPDQFLDPEWNCYWTISSETDKTSHWLFASVYAQMGVSRRDDTHCVSRCVLGPPYDYENGVPPAYEIANGTIKDPATHLEWQNFSGATAGKGYSLVEAEKICADLVLAGHDDWRLPNVKELETLVDERRILPSLDPRVAGEPQTYWSSTPHEPLPTDGGAPAGRVVLKVSFADGTTVPSDDEAIFPGPTARVRCVRDF